MMKILNLATLLLLSTILYSQDRKADSLILVEIYHQLDGPNWNNSENWLTSEPLEEWEGINLLDDRVSRITLTNQNLSGPFPEQITKLDKLSSFDIRQGNVTGSIPEDLTQLKELGRFNVSNNKLSGTVPNIWTEFPKLKYLIFSFNDFEGSLPEIPDGMILFYAQSCGFSGPIPESWEGVSLAKIILSGNELTGSLDIFETWPILSIADFSYNNWDEGPLPMWIDTKENINSFICSNCNLVGDIPPGFDLRDNLIFEQIVIDGNEIGGNIAALFIGPDSSKKMYLNVYGNRFSGSFPGHLAHSVETINIGANNFTSLTAFPESLSFNNFGITDNKFNYEALEPIRTYVELDSIIHINYNRMQKTMTSDTLTITEPTTITMIAGDNHPNTTYEWDGPLVDGMTESIVNLVIDEFSTDGTYTCHMSNESFPDLNLRRNDIIIRTDFSTSVSSDHILDIKIYPNPSNDIISISMENDEIDARYKLVSQEGKIVDSGRIKNNGQLNIKELKSGIYYLELWIGEEKTTKTIIKF